ncbi:MAG: hypothetical protein ACRDL7_03150, partial [Gaiellaceae bacterium]
MSSDIEPGSSVDDASTASTKYPELPDYGDILMKIGLSHQHVITIRDRGGIETINDFKYLSNDDMNDIISMIFIPTFLKAKFKAFGRWVRQRDGVVQTVDFNTDTLLEEMKQTAQQKDDSSNNIERNSNDVKKVSTLPDPFNGLEKHFKKFRNQFEAYIGTIGLTYIIKHNRKHQINDTDDSTSILNITTLDDYNPDMNSKAFKKDNNFVYNLLKRLTSGTGSSAYSHLVQFDDAADGRSAWIAMRDYFEGDAVLNSVVTEARKAINSTLYRGENHRGMNFDKYVAIHVENNTILDEHG